MESNKFITVKLEEKILGFGLIEILVALCIFAVALLGLAKLQFRTIEYQKQMQQSQQARYLLNDLAEIYQSHASIDQNNLVKEWQQQITQQLPGAYDEITAQDDYFLAVLIWQADEKKQQRMQRKIFPLMG